MLVVNDRIQVPLRELEFTYARSSGPGGQNVNKVASKVVLHWNVARSSSLPQDVRERFLARYKRRIRGDGVLVLTSQRYRDQARNVADCLEKLRQMLADVATAPRKRRKTKPTRSSVERRLKGKRMQGTKKRERRPPGRDD